MERIQSCGVELGLLRQTPCPVSEPVTFGRIHSCCSFNDSSFSKTTIVIHVLLDIVAFLDGLQVIDDSIRQDRFEITPGHVFDLLQNVILQGTTPRTSSKNAQ